MSTARRRGRGVGVGERRRHERREDQTGTLPEGIESPKTFFAGDRAFVFVEDYDRVLADQEAPFASDAVVKPRRPPKEVDMTLRSDYEVVPEPGRSRRSCAGAPELHGRPERKFHTAMKARNWDKSGRSRESLTCTLLQ